MFYSLSIFFSMNPFVLIKGFGMDVAERETHRHSDFRVPSHPELLK
jgi:hypothetical protein